LADFNVKNMEIEEMRQKLYRFTDSCIINQRAVDEGKITPQARDEMYMRNANAILDLLTSDRLSLVEMLNGMKKEDDGTHKWDSPYEYCGCEVRDYNRALTDIISRLKK